MPGDVCTGIKGENEDLSVNDDETMELANCYQKKSIQGVKLGIALSKIQQEKMINTLSRLEKFFSDIPDKTNIIEHKLELTDNKPVRFRPYLLP